MEARVHYFYVFIMETVDNPKHYYTGFTKTLDFKISLKSASERAFANKRL
jgi:hypothetical protein